MGTPQSWVEIRRLVSAARPRWAPVETQGNTDDQGAVSRDAVHAYRAMQKRGYLAGVYQPPHG
jgi:hypothetical protein